MNKGDAKHSEYRSRLAAKEIKHDEREDLFAATPPLEAQKLLFSQWASICGMCLDPIDAARASLDTSEEGDLCGVISRRP